MSVLVAIAGTTIMAAGPASALGGEWVGCRVVPTTPDIQFTQYCANRTLIVGTYTAGFQVFNTSGSYSSITWALPAGVNPAAGCGSGDFTCSINLSSSRDHWVSINITFVQNGSSLTVNSGARINAVCSLPSPFPGLPPQPILC